MDNHKNNLLPLTLSFSCEFEVEKSIKSCPHPAFAELNQLPLRSHTSEEQSFKVLSDKGGLYGAEQLRVLHNNTPTDFN